MKNGWRVVMIIVLVCIIIGAVCVGVGTLTGADPSRVTAILERTVEERYNVDAYAFIHSWIPEVAGILRGALPF